MQESINYFVQSCCVLTTVSSDQLFRHFTLSLQLVLFVLITFLMICWNEKETALIYYVFCSLLLPPFIPLVFLSNNFSLFFSSYCYVRLWISCWSCVWCTLTLTIFISTLIHVMSACVLSCVWWNNDAIKSWHTRIYTRTHHMFTCII